MPHQSRHPIAKRLAKPVAREDGDDLGQSLLLARNLPSVRHDRDRASRERAAGDGRGAGGRVREGGGKSVHECERVREGSGKRAQDCAAQRAALGRLLACVDVHLARRIFADDHGRVRAPTIPSVVALDVALVIEVGLRRLGGGGQVDELGLSATSRPSSLCDPPPPEPAL